MTSIKIDGKQIQASTGQMIIEVADEEGIAIPRFCYHKHLSIAANCRMCLVEVTNSPKTLPACATPIVDGMEIYTKSPKAIESQKAVMEFLLINHPLDCPICDQGGECELQDVSMGYGLGVSTYQEEKRVVDDENLGPLISTDMTRCIHCTRCVRFGEEIVGLKELGATGRGERMRIGTFIAHSMKSTMSGNVIDLCPVGALTSRPYRYTARAWELKQCPAISPHDCVGSPIFVHVRSSQVMRVTPREEKGINEVWISDRDRFSYLGLDSSDRVSAPMIKKEGKWCEVDWETALKQVADGCRQVVQQEDQGQLAGIISPNSTLEELYLFQKWLRGMGCYHIDHRLKVMDTSHQEAMPLSPAADIAYQDIEYADGLLLVGSNIESEQPLLSTKIRKAIKNNATACVLNPIDFPFHFTVTVKCVVHVHEMVTQLAGCLKELCQKLKKTTGLSDLLRSVQIDPRIRDIAKCLMCAKNPVIFMGALACHHPQSGMIHLLVKEIASIIEGKVVILTDGCNSTGAWLAGAIPHRGPAGSEVVEGFSVKEAFEHSLKGYCLMGVEPELDCVDPAKALSSLKAAEFVAILSTFKSDAMLEYANVILPISPYTETEGTYVNLEGRWQSFEAASKPLEEVRPGWKVLRVLANLCNITGCDYMSANEVAQELKILIDLEAWSNKKENKIPLSLPTTNSKSLVRVSEWPVYRSDSLVRRAKALQETPLVLDPSIRVNSQLAKYMKVLDRQCATVIQNGLELELPLVIDDRIADNNVYVLCGHEATQVLGDPFGEIQLRP